MIDIHCHILPHVDDGPKSLEEALTMAGAAYDDGIRTIVSTSHFMEGDYIKGQELTERLNSFNEALQKEKIDIRVLPGNEAYISPDLPQQVKENKVFTINNSRYLLVELPFREIPLYTDQVLYDLQLQGIVPIMAHPERYRPVMDNPNVLYNWISNGALAQLNAGSLTGKFGEQVQKTAQLLLRHHMIHFIGSDGHSARGRRPILSEALRELEEGTHTKVELFHENAKKLIANEDIIVDKPMEYRKQKKHFFSSLLKSLMEKPPGTRKAFSK